LKLKEKLPQLNSPLHLVAEETALVNFCFDAKISQLIRLLLKYGKAFVDKSTILEYI
jgi:hypothetical protein